MRQRAEQAGVNVHLTEMWNAHDLTAEEHRRTFDRPDRYTFVDVSQNNHKHGDVHWNNLQWVVSRLNAQPRPINTVKTYGADGGRHGRTDQIGLERWWRSVLGGVAGARFHRPPSGLGFGAKAEASVRAARKLKERVKFWDLVPAMGRLRSRESDTAYAAAQPARTLAVYLPRGGSVEADLAGFLSDVVVRWLGLETAAWGPEASAAGEAWMNLAAPSPGAWIALIELRGPPARKR